MELIVEIIKFFIYGLAIVVISKYMLVPTLRKVSKELGLSAKTSGNIAGFATSVPELLTVTFAAYAGLVQTGIYNVISSNIINFIQYLFAVYINKKQKYINNKAIKIDIVLVVITIIIPVLLILSNIEIKAEVTIFFILLFILFYYINLNIHKLYLKEEDKEIEEKYKKDSKEKFKVFKVIINVIILIIISILLYIVGELLSVTLSNLNNHFGLPEILLGILIGFITSIPELITFMESIAHNKKQDNNEKIGVIEATNNLLTSNVLNLFIIQSIGIWIYSFFRG